MSTQLAVPNTETRMNALVPTSITDALRLADVMSQANLMPDHLRGKAGDCLLVVMQAQRWGMDVVSVAQCTSVVRGKLCYEGKLVAAVLYSMGAIDGRLRYSFSGAGQKRGVLVTGRARGEKEDQTVEGTVESWATDNGNWKKNPDDMLVYRGTRQWARRYAPEALLGVYTPDEMEEPADIRVVSTIPASRAELPKYSPEDFEKNQGMWSTLIESGKSTPDRIIAMVETKFVMSAEQKAAIAKLAKPAVEQVADVGEAA